MSDKLNHYVAKNDIARSVVEGIPAKALCGELVYCMHQGRSAVPGHEAESQDAALCLDCDFIFHGFQKDEASKPEPVREKEAV